MKLKKFSQTEKHILEAPFPEVYGGFLKKLSTKPRRVTPTCTTLLKITSVLTLVMTIIALILNYSRCTFVDVFVGITFFGNVYVW